MDSTKRREAFETWAVSNQDWDLRLNRSGDGYRSEFTDAAWQAWNAAPPAMEGLVEALKGAERWITSAPHGDNCFLHDDGGEFDACRCGKESVEKAISSALAAPEAALREALEIDRLGPVSLESELRFRHEHDLHNTPGYRGSVLCLRTEAALSASPPPHERAFK